MSELSLQQKSIPFYVGYGVLLLIVVGSVFGHLALMIFEPGDELLFLSVVAFEFLTALILIIPYRAGQKWAWFAVWAIVFYFASVILFNNEFGPIYLGVAGILALCQLFTYSYFNRNGATR